MKVKSQLRHPIIASDDSWDTWAAFFFILAHWGSGTSSPTLIYIVQNGYQLWLTFFASESHENFRTHGNLGKSEQLVVYRRFQVVDFEFEAEILQLVS